MQLANNPEVKVAIQVNWWDDVTGVRDEVLSEFKLDNFLLQQQGHAVRVQGLDWAFVVEEPRDLREQGGEQAILREGGDWGGVVVSKEAHEIRDDMFVSWEIEATESERAIIEQQVKQATEHRRAHDGETGEFISIIAKPTAEDDDAELINAKDLESRKTQVRIHDERVCVDQ